MESALLKITFPDGNKKEVPLSLKPLEIGRNPEAGIVIQIPEISRRHCSFKLVDDQFFVIDHDSANGTFLNKKKITFSPLHDGDEVTFGNIEDVVIRFFNIVPTAQNFPEKGKKESYQKFFSGEALRQSMGDNSSALDLTSFSFGEGSGSIQLKNQIGVMFQVSKLLLRSPDYISLNKDIAQCILDSFSADRVLLIRGIPFSNGKYGFDFQLESSRTKGNELDSESFSETIVQRVFNEDVAISSSREDSTPSGSFVSLGITQSLAVPIRGQEKVFGVIICDTQNNYQVFSETDLDPLSAIGNQLGLAWENFDLQREKLQSEKLAAVGEAVANLAHYIKNVLACSESGAGLVDEALNAGNMEILGKAWDLVKNSNEKIQQLVKELLSLSKVRTIKKKKDHLNLFLQGLLDQVVFPLNGKVKGQTFLDRNLPEVPIDQYALEDAFRNIFQNAIEAGESATVPQLTISVTTQFMKAENQCKITIHDNGPGIPPDILPNIWNLFYSTKGARGSGLGMTVTQKVIEEHGGAIGCESLPAKGTTFVILLPMI